MTVYFDNAATTRVRPEAVDVMVRVMTEQYGNPSSTHTMGREAKSVLDTARKHVAAAMGARPDEITFTSGGTEADNWAILGGASLMQHRGRHIITTATEHDAVRKPVEKLKAKGWEVDYLRPDKTGRVTVDRLAELLRPDTVLVSVMLVNNETGAVNPVEEMAKYLKNSGSQALFHTDAVQAFCKLPFTPKKLGADLVSVSGHKIYGPKGVGALYIREGLRLPAMIMGGGQEKERRSGTEALPAIAAFGEAARLGKAELTANSAAMMAVRQRVLEGVQTWLPEAVVIGAGDVPHILSISLPGYRSEVLMNCLEADGICVSKSSACKKGGRSHVLEAMGLANEIIDGAIRVSFSKDSTAEEADYLIARLCAARDRLHHTKK